MKRTAPKMAGLTYAPLSAFNEVDEGVDRFLSGLESWGAGTQTGIRE